MLLHDIHRVFFQCGIFQFKFESCFLCALFKERFMGCRVAAVLKLKQEDFWRKGKIQ